MAGEADEQEELQRALQMSLQPAPEAKRSKPREGPATLQDMAAQARRTERELRAAAAEQRMLALRTVSNSNAHPLQPLPLSDAKKLFDMVFDQQLDDKAFSQWSNQGFRFSSDHETSLGLVQTEAGPCGVLAPVQAMVLKYLLFENREAKGGQSHSGSNFTSAGLPDGSKEGTDPALLFPDAERTRALVSAMAEILWLIGGKKKAVVTVIDYAKWPSEADGAEAGDQDNVISHALEGVSFHKSQDLQTHLRLCICTSISSLQNQLRNWLPIFRSRFGALLFLFSAVISRGLDPIQADWCYMNEGLITGPYGHASQEIVNLLICGQAVSQVFDGDDVVGGGLHLKGIPSKVEVGFLTIHETVKHVKVGQYLKRPTWPIWVVGSDSHYTVLFALQCSVQEDNELEERERRIRQAFDALDKSGGGGFISADSLKRLLDDLKINMPRDMVGRLSSNEIVVWNELWQALHQIEESKGGLKDSSARGGVKEFRLYHFNGIAKTVGKSSSADDSVEQRPRLTKLRVRVPPKWTPEDFDAGSSAEEKMATDEPAPQHAPLVDCIRTRWERASCNWDGDAPSIV